MPPSIASGHDPGASIIFLGLFKLVLGLLFGESLVDLLRRFPNALLAVMIVAAGLELAGVGESLNTARARDIGKDESSLSMNDTLPSDRLVVKRLDEAERKRRWTVMLVTAGLLLAFKNDAIGFMAGMFCHWSYEMPMIFDRLRHGGRRGRITLNHTAEDATLVPHTN